MQKVVGSSFISRLIRNRLLCRRFFSFGGRSVRTCPEPCPHFVSHDAHAPVTPWRGSIERGIRLNGDPRAPVESGPPGARSVSGRADHRLVLWCRAVIGAEVRVEIRRMQPSSGSSIRETHPRTGFIGRFGAVASSGNQRM
jgi:hypothetical protein